MVKIWSRAVIGYFVCFALCLVPFASHAFKQSDLDKLLATKECQWCDLTNASLAGAQLSGANLSGANVSRAKLAGSDLSNANLSTTYLRDSDLSGANLTGAFMGKANLNGATLTGATLSGADLSGATWTDGSKCQNKSVGDCVRVDVIRPANEAPSMFPPDFQQVR
jgi:uncharacterized protein YjbI with pentapeptide repeats